MNIFQKFDLFKDPVHFCTKEGNILLTDPGNYIQNKQGHIFPHKIYKYQSRINHH